ncbi:MAG: hypothetical protein P1U87_20040 [Verrucomicrobiales bacterium]|nr:hypothetical protein [Verrucomicrobiales bacterium]
MERVTCRSSRISSQIAMFSSSLSRNLFLPLLALSMGGWLAASDEPPVFSVKFGPKGVAFSGGVPSEEVGQTLAEAVKAVRPDLAIINEGIHLDSEAKLPNLADLKSLIAEIGISTHEGGVAIWDDAILLSGLTDSRITLAALKIRLDPLLGNKRLINRICIVPTDDLPDIAVKLSNGEAAGPLLDFDYYPTAEEMFEAPGIRLEKLFPTMALLADLNVLDDSKPLTSSPPEPAPNAPLRAIPLMSSKSPGAITPAMFRAVPAGPQNTYVALESIRFSRNSFFLQANQESTLGEMLKQLSAPPLAGHKVILRPVVYAGGAGVYGDYLVEKRSDEAKRLLIERGVDPSRLVIRTVTSQETLDQGEVKVVVEIPPPPPPKLEEEAGEGPTEADGTEEEESGGTPP